MHPYYERLEKEAAKAEEVKDGLTVADILRRKQGQFRIWHEPYSILCHLSLGRYFIFERQVIGENLILDTLDESAAVAEFLRLTEGE